MGRSGANRTLNRGFAVRLGTNPVRTVGTAIEKFEIPHQDSLKTLRNFANLNNSIFYTLSSVYII